MNRRDVLAGVACSVAALAGCVEHPDERRSVGLDMLDTTPAELAERASRSVDGAPEPTRSVVASAVANGSATADRRNVSLDPDRPIAYEGGYYEVTRSEDGREVRRWSLEVDYDPPADADGPTVAYADLPAVDREALDDLLPPPVDHPGTETVASADTVYGPDGEAASALVPDQQYEFVTYDGERYGLDVWGPWTRTVEAYRYEAEHVADSAASYGEWVRAEYQFALEGLSDAEREIVETAVYRWYRADEPSAAFASLEARFREHPGFGVDEYGGEWVVSYEGTTYWAELDSRGG